MVALHVPIIMAWPWQIPNILRLTICLQEQKEMELLEEQRRKQYEAEMARLEKEAEEREKQRRIEEHTTIQKRLAKERLDQLKSTELGAKAFADLKEDVSCASFEY